ncbi:MAG TPA: carboxyl transferase domain-containing protein [Acidimicrobiales bacterium]|nr:carboxyl transferase domain-containing protein [Acidimicrobiales bacterium]
MTWEPELEELRRRTEMAKEMGGPDKVARQHEFGKLTVRERVERVVDAGSFEEIGTVAGVGQYDEAGDLVAFTPSNFVFGAAEVDGRPVIVSGDDFTVRGGSADASIGAKRNHAEGLALDLRLPHIRLVDGMGGGGSVKTIETLGRTPISQMRGWDTVLAHLSVAPSVSLALGSVAGIGAARVATSHYSVIVKDTAQMMIAGPALVDFAMPGPHHDKNELGGSHVHVTNGAIDDEAESEDEAFAMARRFLSYLPTSVDELPPRADCTDDPERRDEVLVSIVPRNPRHVYKMRAIIESIADREADGATSFFEIGRQWGKSIVCGLARFHGWPVALFAEDPYIYGGAWTASSSQKVTRLIDLATLFHLPLVHLVDCPGFLIGLQAEQEATIRHGSRALAALGESPSPYFSVVIRKAFGVAGAANWRPGSFHYRCAWPSGDWGSLPVEGGIEVAYKAELDDAPDRDAHLAAIRARLDKVRSPFRSAEAFDIEDIIDPRDTRPLICRWADLAGRVRQPGPSGLRFRP